MESLPGNWPDALKASVEQVGVFAMKLRTGEILFYYKADYDPETPEWVNILPKEPDRLSEINSEYFSPKYNGRFLGLSYGIDIRVADIVWVAIDPWSEEQKA